MDRNCPDYLGKMAEESGLETVDGSKMYCIGNINAIPDLNAKIYTQLQ